MSVKSWRTAEGFVEWLMWVASFAFIVLLGGGLVNAYLKTPSANVLEMYYVFMSAVGLLLIHAVVFRWLLNATKITDKFLAYFSKPKHRNVGKTVELLATILGKFRNKEWLQHEHEANCKLLSEWTEKHIRRMSMASNRMVAYYLTGHSVYDTLWQSAGVFSIKLQGKVETVYVLDFKQARENHESPGSRLVIYICIYTNRMWYTLTDIVVETPRFGDEIALPLKLKTLEKQLMLSTHKWE